MRFAVSQGPVVRRLISANLVLLKSIFSDTLSIPFRASNHQIVDKNNYCEFTFQPFICMNSVNSAWTTWPCCVKTLNDFKIQRFYREFTDTVTVWKPFLWNKTLLFCHTRQTKQVNKLSFQEPFSVALPLLLKGGSCKNLLIRKH